MLKVAAIIHQSKDKVWDSFTNADHITKWNFAHPSWCCPKSSVDLRVGGEMNNRMEAVDGSMGFDLKAKFDVVNPCVQLDYTLEDGRKVTCSFEEENGSVTLTQCFDPEKENPEEMQTQGWQAILNNFKNYTEQL
ncbi:Uncharacterized conserved protein YndB, AHSA1/START domain [Lishizhenia tianjinensis]|uniref:Uncharacterized conserved protein YndB, AHSA1/START domain n=1 Tax=Lishizhenia tianjinensis TaxID=477690 RepID=A0A1I7AD74_9FLAO|nr:SRPBCC domain-containing protein [Lishizhenia tianjinensis]SFT72881.1 Uncharacterized conserved protein YndB, AHSA1/START domain [Lishizhenia tianjinensis]